MIFSACSLNLSKKDDPLEQTKNYVIGLKANQTNAQIVSLRFELNQLNQAINALGPISETGENLLEKASSTKAKLQELEERLKEIEKIK